MRTEHDTLCKTVTSINSQIISVCILTSSEDYPLMLGSTSDAFSNDLYRRSTIQPSFYPLSLILAPPLGLLIVGGSFYEVQLLSGIPIDAGAWVHRAARARVHLSAATFFTGLMPMRRF